LWGVPLEDLLDELVVLLCELEGDAGIVSRTITVLIELSALCEISGELETYDLEGAAGSSCAGTEGSA